ncbi:MAG: flagellar assembly protein FliW [Firmicutes bacterium]|nr:flagellar assembly protein FliW [Bacillota bacterium]
MNIQTAFLGEVKIEESQIIRFDYGLPGFEEENKFTIIPLEESSVYQVLQSVQTPQIAFITVNPFAFTNYNFDLDESTVHTLEIKSEEDVAIISIVTVKEPFSDSTINLKAPIVINTKSQKAKQAILENSEFPLRHPITSGKG